MSCSRLVNRAKTDKKDFRNAANGLCCKQPAGSFFTAAESEKEMGKQSEGGGVKKSYAQQL